MNKNNSKDGWQHLSHLARFSCMLMDKGDEEALTAASNDMAECKSRDISYGCLAYKLIDLGHYPATKLAKMDEIKRVETLKQKNLWYPLIERVKENNQVSLERFEKIFKDAIHNVGPYAMKAMLFTNNFTISKKLKKAYIAAIDTSLRSANEKFFNKKGTLWSASKDDMSAIVNSHITEMKKYVEFEEQENAKHANGANVQRSISIKEFHVKYMMTIWQCCVGLEEVRKLLEDNIETIAEHGNLLAKTVLEVMTNNHSQEKNIKQWLFAMDCEKKMNSTQRCAFWKAIDENRNLLVRKGLRDVYENRMLDKRDYGLDMWLFELSQDIPSDVNLKRKAANMNSFGQEWVGAAVHVCDKTKNLSIDSVQNATYIDDSMNLLKRTFNLLRADSGEISAELDKNWKVKGSPEYRAAIEAMMLKYDIGTIMDKSRIKASNAL